MISKHALHIIGVVISVLIVAIIGFMVKAQLVPESFGIYGAYRAEAIDEEAHRTVRHGTSASCFGCHPYEATSHLEGDHKTISCEFCHGTYADHVAKGKKTGTLPVKKGTEITTLCLRCHNTEIKARSTIVIKTVGMPDHLSNQNVKVTHICNQCHYVHAPLKYINEARKITGLMEAES